MLCGECGVKDAEEGRNTVLCFRCRVKGVGFRLQGGGVTGNKAWNTTRREFLEEHTGTSSEKELARTRPDVEKV